MAQNWNVKQALAAINKGNKEAITDIGRRFPLTLSVLSMLKGNDAAEELVNAIPDHITTRKIEAALKDGIQVDDSDNDVEESEAEEETTKENKATAGTEYDSMSRVQLRDLIRNAGGEKKCREEFGWAKREQLLAYIEKYGLEGGEAEVENDAEEETTEDNPYAGKNAMELFKECKKRGIKAKPKQKAAFYVDLLVKDDESKAETSDDADDDWEDEEEEKPAKNETKKKTSTKKAIKKEEPKDDDDDDDDWNI